MLDRSAREKKQGTDLKEAAAHQLEIVRHRLRRRLGLQLADWHVAEDRLRIDACSLIGTGATLEPQPRTNDLRHDCGRIFVLGRELTSARRLDPDPAGRIRRRLGLVCGTERKQAWVLLRARDPPTRRLAQRPGAVAEGATGRNKKFGDALAEHGLHGVAPKLGDRPNPGRWDRRLEAGVLGDGHDSPPILIGRSKRERTSPSNACH
jgi:hypothetical protein